MYTLNHYFIYCSLYPTYIATTDGAILLSDNWTTPEGAQGLHRYPTSPIFSGTTWHAGDLSHCPLDVSGLVNQF